MLEEGLSKAQAKKETEAIWEPEPVFPHTCELDFYSQEPRCDSHICEHHSCGYDCNEDCRNYICDLCYQPDPTPSPTLGPTPGSEQLLIHAKMYEIADKYHVVGLKELAMEKFRRACQDNWHEPGFAVAAYHAFSTTPDNDLGLRDIVSLTIATHMTELMKKPEVEALLLEFNGLAFGLLKRKMDQGWK